MKKTLFILLAGSFIFSFAFAQQAEANKSFQHPALTKKWSTAPVLITPESVLFNKAANEIYVANINGKPTEKDGNGFIAKLSADGKINVLQWVKGLNAPKGMGLNSGTLYVTDIDAVAEIDIQSAKISKRYEAPNAKFLNDISIDKNGVVYISDMQADNIYRLKDGKLTIWLEAPELKHPNGLWVEGNELLIGINGAVLKCNLETKKVSTYIKDTGSIDGLVADGKGNYLISDWQGHVHLIHPGKDKVLLLDTTPEKINAADIEYIVKSGILLVPTFFDNRVVAYQINF